MFEKLDHCPLCNSGHFSNYLICKDHSVSEENFAIVKCNECQLLFTNPRPTPAELSKYYDSEEYISHQNKSNSLINSIYKLARVFTLRGKINLINQHSTKGNILDIGCGTGHFLTKCIKDGWQATGIEPNQTAKKLATENGIQVYEELKEIDTSIKYKVISMWHVLEHVTDLNFYLKTIHKLLDKNGTFFVAVPNINSKDADIYKEKWAAYDVPRHLYHFSQQTMRALMKKHGFKISGIIPMKLDSFYVSLLSEKYKGKGLSRFITAFSNGLKSNSYAKHNNNNYSSLIYIIRKS